MYFKIYSYLHVRMCACASVYTTCVHAVKCRGLKKVGRADALELELQVLVSLLPQVVI